MVNFLVKTRILVFPVNLRPLHSYRHWKMILATRTFPQKRRFGKLLRNESVQVNHTSTSSRTWLILTHALCKVNIPSK